MTVIKICGVTTPEEGLFSGVCGADFVGIVMHALSKRYVQPSEGQSIASAIREGGAVPVAVFLDESESEIMSAIERTDITTIQTYRDVNLPCQYTIIYANPNSRGGNRASDYYLFDGPNPGSGEKLRPEHLPTTFSGNFFLAGGIDCDNVQELLQRYHPTGVDVSSGVETNGKKDFLKIQTFIQKVRDYDKTIR